MRGLDLPMEFPLEPYGDYTVEEWVWAADVSDGEAHSEHLMVVAERTVDPDGMAAADDPLLYRRQPGGSVAAAPAIFSPEIGDLAEGASCICGAICYASGVSLAFGPFVGIDEEFPSRYIAESRQDERTLEMLGTTRPRLPLSGRTGVEVFGGGSVGARLIHDLASRRAVRVYPEVLHNSSPGAIFRDLWRALEAAFQAEGKQLTKLLSEFPPAQRLGFDRAELEGLRALRGQLSHASSRLGLAEISRSEDNATESLGRLWSLVDWVILSKKDSSRSLEHDELRPLAAFIRRDGSVQVEPGIDDRSDWHEHYGASSARFRDTHG